MAAKLSLGDIVDLRVYERERDEFRTRVIELKRRRRVHVGPVVTLVFENRETIRFQIQEMARAERMLTDEAIRSELDAYNPLIPPAGGLSATLFIELTSDDELREWLPKLVGIERSVQLVLGEGTGSFVVRAEPEADHAAQLTREEITASVHYITWSFTPEQVERSSSLPWVLAVDHRFYHHGTTIGPETRRELLSDLAGLD